jgi:hypothetical protein
MCKSCGEWVENLWNSFGNFHSRLVEKTGFHNFMWRINNLFTNFYQKFPLVILPNLPLLVFNFSPLSTPIIVATKLKKGIIK